MYLAYANKTKEPHVLNHLKNKVLNLLSFEKFQYG